MAITKACSYRLLKQYHSCCVSLLEKPIFLNSTTTIQKRYFWEPDRKGGYNTADQLEKVSIIKHIKNGFQELKSELKLFGREVRDVIEMDPLLIARPGEVDLLWLFNDQNVLENFVTTSDSDNNEGYSFCNLSMSPAGRVNFHGHLDVRVPKDGRIKKTGYCAMRSKRTRVAKGQASATVAAASHIFLLNFGRSARVIVKSFKRDGTYDWNLYNTLVLKVRGDGRSYLLNISCEGYYDITWNDIYHYVLYTRGGPYWQVAKIPFSKFILGSKGRIQDKQNRMRLDKVTHFGISCGDKINGPFNLEIEYVGLEYDPTHDEEFAYEMYKTEKHIVGV